MNELSLIGSIARIAAGGLSDDGDDIISAIQGIKDVNSPNSLSKKARNGIYEFPFLVSGNIENIENIAVVIKGMECEYANMLMIAMGINPTVKQSTNIEIQKTLSKYHTNDKDWSFEAGNLAHCEVEGNHIDVVYESSMFDKAYWNSMGKKDTSPDAKNHQANADYRRLYQYAKKSGFTNSDFDDMLKNCNTYDEYSAYVNKVLDERDKSSSSSGNGSNGNSDGNSSGNDKNIGGYGNIIADELRKNLKSKDTQRIKELEKNNANLQKQNEKAASQLKKFTDEEQRHERHMTGEDMNYDGSINNPKVTMNMTKSESIVNQKYLQLFNATVVSVNIRMGTDKNSEYRLTVGIKGIPHFVPYEELVYVLSSFMNTRVDTLITRFIRWRTGEVKGLHNLFLRYDEIKRDADFDRRVGTSNSWLKVLRSRGNNRRFNKIVNLFSKALGHGSRMRDILPNCTFVLSLSDVDLIENECGVNIFQNPESASKLLDDSMGLGLVITDDVHNVYHIMYSGESRFATYPLGELQKFAKNKDHSDITMDLAKIMKR